MSQIKVYMYFLRFNAEDLKVFYDERGIAAVSYTGNYVFLHNDRVIQHCFEEGYIDRMESVALILYAFTEDPVLAKSFELSRNSRIFVKKTAVLSEEEFQKLNRYTEARLSTEQITIGPNQYLNITVNQLEISKIVEMDEETIVTEFDCDDLLFMPLENGISFQDDLFGDSLTAALETFKFKQLMGECECGPSEAHFTINEWNIFYAYFSDTLGWK